MVGGVHGTNFDHMPELHRRFGHPLALGVIAVARAVIRRGFQRNGRL